MGCAGEFALSAVESSWMDGLWLWLGWKVYQVADLFPGEAEGVCGLDAWFGWVEQEVMGYRGVWSVALQLALYSMHRDEEY